MREKYSTTLEKNMIKSLKILAVEKDKAANDLLEEAITDLFKKYEKKV